MRNDYERMFYLPGGSIAAIVLGMALVPLREVTHSANFIFAFMVLIIVVAEFGGRWAALATATCSALSLNFFLTQPYLSLRIAGKHDVIAFVGLTICGMVAAAFGSRRGDAVASLRETRAHVDLLHAVAEQAQAAGPLEPRLEEALRASREALPLAELVVRDARGGVVAASGRAPEPRPSPGLTSCPTLSCPPGPTRPICRVPGCLCPSRGRSWRSRPEAARSGGSSFGGTGSPPARSATGPCPTWPGSWR